MNLTDQAVARAIELVARRWRDGAALPVAVVLDGQHHDVRDLLALAGERDDLPAGAGAIEAAGAPAGASVALIARLVAARAEIDFTRLRPALPPAPDLAEIDRQLGADLVLRILNSREARE